MNWIDLFIDSRTVGAYDKPTFTESEVAKFKDFNKLDEFIYQKEGLEKFLNINRLKISKIFESFIKPTNSQTQHFGNEFKIAQEE